ncbi:Growth-regulating factor 10 [Hibiscus syriacus]|uniref:Growth-regulating factor n=1 Tax=Hibiscus syriacus TaxID=106335 RepID=A0A6A3CF79_HIBSY|nr:Growth-regulating factor 10 [Hibiscus syriacus]
MMMGHYDNHHRPFPSFGDSDGPMGNDNRAKTSNMYHVLASSSDYGSGAAAATVGNGGAVGLRILQPFDISSTSSSTAHTAIKSPGEMAACLEFPFTFSQRKELERQVMIFKYMMASVPVPVDLLLPSVPVASHSALGGGALNLRLAGSGDVEPGRCKRTDGKKWRCSRDVAPNHKYCERHLHRGRPRSRKHVELPNKRTRHTHGQALPSSSSAVLTKIASPPLAQPPRQNQTTWFLDKPHEKAATFWPLTSVSSYKEPRISDWTMNELIPLADQQWHQLMQIGLASDGSMTDANNSFVLGQNYAAGDQQPNSFPWFLNSEIEKSGESTPRGFIDAWSTGVSGDSSGAEASVSSNGKLSLSSLSLSMGINNITDNELGVCQYDEDHEYASISRLSSWFTPGSTTPGGPLAEVLRPSSATKSSSNLSSPVTGNGNSCSPPVTAVSSPSGVLQRTPASMSDSIGSSSPTLVSSSVKPEISLMLA